MAFRMSLSESLQISTMVQQELENEVLREKSGRRILKQQHHHKQQQQEKTMNFGVQLMLVASLFGLEMVIAFGQIYSVLFMLFLGVPTSLVSLNGVICGACSMCILPIVGSCIDKGPNPRMRKMLSLYIGMCMFLLGMIFLLICGIIRLDPNNSPYEMTNASAPFYENTTSIDDIYFLDDRISLDKVTTHSTYQDSASVPSYVTSNSISVTVTATLSLLAFSFNDMGFDMSCSLTRAYVLECLPASQHTKILILATTAQSIAGMAFCCFGLFDFPSIFREAFGVDGTAATILFFSSLLFTTTLICFMSTTITGYLLRPNNDTSIYVNEIIPSSDRNGDFAKITSKRQSRKADDNDKTALVQNGQSKRSSKPYKPDILHTEESSLSTRPLQFEDSLEVGNHLSKIMKTSHSLDDYPENYPETNEKSLLLGPSRKVKYDARSNRDSMTETDNLALDDKTDTEEQEACSCGSLSVPRDQKKPVDLKNDKKNQDGERSKQKIKLDKRLVALVVSEFFGFGSMLTFAMYVANALTVGILGGEPTAPQGSEGRLRYESGLQTAALGNLIHYIAYFIVSLNNERIIDHLGPKLQSVLGHLALIVMTLTFVLTKSMPVYYLSMVAMGFYRPCVYTVPFLLANRYARDMETSNDPKTSQPTNIGRVMSLLGFQLPFHYLILSSVVGPSLDATGDAFMPLMYCIVAATFSLMSFSTLFLMKNS